MALFDDLLQRAHSTCELCSKASELSLYEIPSSKKAGPDTSLVICDVCRSQVEGSHDLEVNHWRCLNESMWSEHQPVQVMAFRMLSRLKDHGWAQDLLEQLYLDGPILEWARAGLPEEEEVDSTLPTLDSNGTRLLDGDAVTLIKDLDVKGAGFTAKRGTLVKDIALTNNPKHIEGKVNGIQIVLVAAYLKKVHAP